MKNVFDKKIKAVIFDVGGVLMGAEPHQKDKKGHGVHDYMISKLGLDIDSWFDSIDTAYAKSIEGKINGEKAVKIIASNLKINPGKLKKIWISAYKKVMKRNKKLYETAFLLKKKSYVIGILSDQWYLSGKALITKEDRKKFSIVIVSCDAGIRKPNPKIYRLLIKKLRKYNIKNYEILFIDNREWNLKPARKLGIKTILFKNNKQVIKDLERYINLQNLVLK